MLGGTSRIEITPPVGVPMAGYLARERAAEEIHDPLFARALVLDDGQQRIAILAAGLLEVTPPMAQAIRERIAAETGIPPSHSMLAPSHTHAGPLVAGRRIARPDLSYVEGLQDKLVAAVRAAADGLRPVRVGAGRGKVYLGVNRRQRTPDNRTVLGKNPAAYASPYVHVLDVTKDNGAPVAVLFSYGAHPNILGPQNLRISADYPGVAERTIEENFGDETVALFALGFAGDVDADCAKRDLAEVETAGVALGRTVLESLKSIRPEPDVSLNARVRRVALSLEPPPPLVETERILYDARESLASVLGRGKEDTSVNERRAVVEWAAELVELAGRDGATPEHTAELEIQVFAIGRTALLGLSAEVFAAYAKPLEESSPFDHTIPISNANGNIGYLPTAAAFDEGGYEVEVAPRLLGTLSFRPEAEGVVRQAVDELLAEVAPAQAAAG
jgi:hypothetical protein